MCGLARSAPCPWLAVSALATRSVGSLPAPPTHTACPNGSGVTEAVARKKEKFFFAALGPCHAALITVVCMKNHDTAAKVVLSTRKSMHPPSDAAVCVGGRVSHDCREELNAEQAVPGVCLVPLGLAGARHRHQSTICKRG